MIKIETTYIYNLHPAIMSIRNALQSWYKSDSILKKHEIETIDGYPIDNGWESFNHSQIGPEDMKLAKRLILRGGDERKFLRTIHVNCEITTTVNHWHEIDTYKIGTVRNSTSTMHSLANRPIEQSDFDSLISEDFLKELNYKLDCFKALKKELPEEIENQRILFKELKDMLPSGYLMMANYDTNYESLLGMYNKRKNHFLLSWIPVIKWLESLPYFIDFYSALEGK